MRSYFVGEQVLYMSLFAWGYGRSLPWWVSSFEW